MGQKVNPISLRLGIINTWSSRWYARRNYAEQLHEDIHVRRFVEEKLKHAGIAKVEIERASEKVRINIHTSRPGIIIGKKGMEVDKLKKDIQKLIANQVFINIIEVRRPELCAKLVAEGIAMQLERRVSFRRAMKKAVQAAMRLGAEGIKVGCNGRLAGAEMARREWYREGRVPLHTLRADIDFAKAESLTTFGRVGVQVWVYRGDILPEAAEAAESAQGVS